MMESFATTSEQNHQPPPTVDAAQHDTAYATHSSVHTGVPALILPWLTARSAYVKSTLVCRPTICSLFTCLPRQGTAVQRLVSGEDFLTLVRAVPLFPLWLHAPWNWRSNSVWRVHHQRRRQRVAQRRVPRYYLGAYGVTKPKPISTCSL